MSDRSLPDLVKVTEVFLIPSSFLVAALGTADSNPHRFGVSLLGLIVNVFWLVCSWEAFGEWKSARAKSEELKSMRILVLLVLPVIFAVGWLVSTVVHTVLWNQPLGRL